MRKRSNALKLREEVLVRELEALKRTRLIEANGPDRALKEAKSLVNLLGEVNPARFRVVRELYRWAKAEGMEQDMYTSQAAKLLGEMYDSVARSFEQSKQVERLLSGLTNKAKRS